MRFNKYLPFAFLYFFLNSLGLPFGLTYTAILSPFLYWWIFKTRRQEIIAPFFVVFIPFILVHLLYVGVSEPAYFISFINLTAVYIFCQAVYTFLKRCQDVELIFRKILIFNFVLCLIAIVFYFTPYSGIFWIEQFLTTGITKFKRLKLFTYEASYYATLFIPIFFFYFLQIILRQNKINAWWLLPMLILPLALSFSLGVMSTMAISILLFCIFYFKNLIRKKRVVNILILLLLVVIPMMVFLYLFYPGNPLFSRITNLFAGDDPSGRGRTFEAFILAELLLDEKNATWGVGLGQIKILGSDIIRNFYLYPLDYPVIAIPNATAETLAIFGWVGLSIRFLVQIFFFFYTRVWRNYFRILLFLFIFFYQFTGSFITNIAEYVIWIFAFTEVFEQFRVKPKPVLTSDLQLPDNTLSKTVNE
jgi:hypothetical protein